MNKPCKALIILFAAVNLCVGLFYVLEQFGDVISGYGGIVILAAAVALIIGGLRNAYTMAKTMIGIIAVIQVPIMLCWNYFFPSRAFWPLILHGVDLIFGVI